MEIYVDNKLAVIKKGTSFDFVSENRYFSGADSYSLSITFPLAGCPENLAIFGHINRKDVVAQKLLFDCEIRNGLFYRHGSITITEISDIEVKTQFLEGKSVSNYADDFDIIYINEMNLGYPDTSPSSFPANSHIAHSISNGLNYLALPWVNNSTGNLQNRTNDTDNWPSSWYYDTRGLSFQPYLIYLLEQICNAVGYSYDFSKLMDSQYRYLIVCNTLPYAWKCFNWATALPHWTLTELFEQLEYFLNGEFDIDHVSKHISFRFSTEAIASAGTVELTNIVDEFSSTVEDAGSCKYREYVNLKFAECNHRKWKYYSCKWFVDMMKTQDVILSYSLGTYNNGKFYKEVNGAQRLYIEMRGAADYVQEEYNGWSPSYLYYCRNEDTYFVLRNYGSYLADPNQPANLSGNTRYLNTLEPVNMFGDSIVDENAETIEMKIVPVWSTANPSYVLPVIALSLSPMANITRLTKTSMLDALGQDYVRTAKAKGVKPVKVIFVHTLRNALIPVITYVGPLTAAILTGSLVVENIFTIGGLGSAFVDSITNRDYTLIMGVTIFLAMIMIIMNLVSDLVYKLVDPRIRLE